MHDGDALSSVRICPRVQDTVSYGVDVVEKLARYEGVVSFGSLEATTQVETDSLEEQFGELLWVGWVGINRSVESEESLVLCMIEKEERRKKKKRRC